MRFRSSIVALAAATALVAPAGAQAAAFVNGSFEQTDVGGFTGWMASDWDYVARVTKSNPYLTPENPDTSITYKRQHGTYFAQLTAHNQDFGDGSNATLLSQEFTVSVDSYLTGRVAFLGGDSLADGPAYNDFGFVRIVGLNGVELYSRDIVGVGNVGETPWQNLDKSFLLLAGETYTLQIGVANKGDNTYPSRMLADRFRVTAAGPVPEPATWAMMLAGFLGMGAVIRRRRAIAA